VKSKIAKIALVGTLALAVVVGIAFAQEGGPESMHHHMHGQMMGMGGPEFAFLHQLNLTDDQKAQVKQIFQAEKPNLKPLHQQEMQAHLQLMQLITSGSFDQAKASAIASQEAQTHAQMVVEHAKIGSQIYQLLNSDQKAKVADMIAKHQQMMQQHVQDQESAAPDQQ
jgi:protein CpxP